MEFSNILLCRNIQSLSSTMCSIPGLPTPGSEVSVLLTRVNPNPSSGLVELWVNIDDGRKHIYQQLREEIQIPERKFDGAEGKPGELCLVSVSEVWHRARIVSSDSENYHVYLIDQGQSHVTCVDALARGKCDSFLLPPEIESYLLANVLMPEDDWPENAKTLLKSLTGKKFNGLVQHVLMPDRIILLDVPDVSKVLCEHGFAKTLAADEFKCFALKCLNLSKGENFQSHRLRQGENPKVSCPVEKHVQFFYPELLTNTFEMVNVTVATNPQNIFCKLLIFSKALKILSEQMHRHYEKSSDLTEEQPKNCGEPCAAKGSDGRWHRSLLRQNVSSDGSVEVLHVDEGKTELVPVEDIKPLNEKFLRMPVVTYPCCLHGVKDDDKGWTRDQIDYLKSQLRVHTVIARFDHHNISQGVYYVTLFANSDASINNFFIKREGLSSPFRMGHDSNIHNEPIPSFVSLLGNEQSTDVQNKFSTNGGVPDESTPSTESRAVSGGAEDVPSTGTNEHVKDVLEHQDTFVQNNGHLSTAFISDVQIACDNHVYSEGSNVNVNISCIESLQKFWCQARENAESLGLLMRALQKHYAFTHPQPLVESICVARNPSDGMWYRAKIIASQCSPLVDVRFIDYGQTQKVPLKDVRPIDPDFLRLNAQAFQCCLFNPNDRTDASVTWSECELGEFRRFVDSGVLSSTGLKCVIRAVTSDADGVLLNVVDIETPSDSASKLLAQRCTQAETHKEIPPQVSTDAYSYSSFSVVEGSKEKVVVTSSESIGHFYCNLEKNSHLLAKVDENIQQFVGRAQRADPPLGVNSLCLAKYTDCQWYRGRVVEMSKKPKVQFVDYGETLVVSDSDVCPLPIEATIARSVPAQAVLLGLFNVPEEVEKEVNQWFANQAVGSSFSALVVAKGENGKLLVELFEGSLNVNEMVRERISQVKQEMTGLDKQITHGMKCNNVLNEDCLTQKTMNVTISLNTTTHEVDNSNGICAGEELEMSSMSVTAQEKTLGEGRQQTLDAILENEQAVVTESQILVDQGDLDDSVQSHLQENAKTFKYKMADVSPKETEEVYASCISGPHYFWCQHTDTAELDEVSRLAQEAGQAQLDLKFQETLSPGSPCLALFTDNQWYRAQVIQTLEDAFRVLFVDYGNESDVNKENVRPVPQGLLGKAPQAFLCTLDGFDECFGHWDDGVYDAFYSLLVDKPIRVRVLAMQDHSEGALTQHAVQIECENEVVNEVMLKYWKPNDKKMIPENSQSETLLHRGQIESIVPCVSTGDVNTCSYKHPRVSKNQKEEVYASCIAEPGYFWCQYANTEELNDITRLAQEAGRAPQDTTLPKTLGPGSPCLALFSTDGQWYRAQIVESHKSDFHVVFIDYGNESDVDMKYVRPLPQSLLEKTPRAFLCSLNGFDRSRGSWDDEVYDVFHNLLVDKLLRLTVIKVEDQLEGAVPQYSVDIECEGVFLSEAVQKYWRPDAKERLLASSKAETLNRDGQAKSSVTHQSGYTENTNTCAYNRPNISPTKKEQVYASCIVEPGYFWCQHANTEELNGIVQLSQGAGQVQLDGTFLQTLSPGGACLALFSSDNQWYRAQVIQSLDDAFHVVFIDYGNESDVDKENVRPLPQSLLEMAPQAFLCSLHGFDESLGSWDDDIYDVFYSLLVDKLLTLTVFGVEDSEIALPQYKVQMECRDSATCEWLCVNTLVRKHWNGLDKNDSSAEGVGSGEQATLLPLNESHVLFTKVCVYFILKTSTVKNVLVEQIF